MADILKLIPYGQRGSKTYAFEDDVSYFELTLEDGRTFAVTSSKDINRLGRILRLYGVRFVETTQEEKDS